MLSSLSIAPRGLAARLVWLGLVLHERMKEAGGAPSPGGNMTTKALSLRHDDGDSPPMLAHAATRHGRADRYDDCHLLREDLGLAIVADGRGGAGGGDIAARVAAAAAAGCFGTQEEHTIPAFEAHELLDGLTVATVRFALEHAHSRVQYAARNGGPPGMSTALALLVVTGRRVVLGRAGDVRALRFRADTLQPLVVEPSAAAAARWPVGAAGAVFDPVVRAHLWQPGDVFVVCTASVHRVLGDEGIRCTVAATSDTAEIASSLVERAARSGASESLTVVVAAPLTRGTAGALAHGTNAGRAEEADEPAAAR
jgi:serine/threonine protein phosphatase PrpC